MSVTKGGLSLEPGSQRGIREGQGHLHLFLMMTVGSDDVSCAWRLPLGCWQKKKIRAWRPHLQFTFCPVSKNLDQEESCAPIFLLCALHIVSQPEAPTGSPLNLHCDSTGLFLLPAWNAHLTVTDMTFPYFKTVMSTTSLPQPSISSWLLLHGSDWHPLRACAHLPRVFSFMAIIYLSIFPTRKLVLKSSMPFAFLFLQR